MENLKAVDPKSSPSFNLLHPQLCPVVMSHKWSLFFLFVFTLVVTINIKTFPVFTIYVSDFYETLKDITDRLHEIQFLLCILHFLPKCWWAVEIMTNMKHCFKIQYAEFPDINLKINYAHEKYVGHVSAKKKSWEKNLN